MHIDKFDQQILLAMQTDGSLSAAQIGDQVGLSQSQAWRRIDRLEREGVIRKRVALVDRKKVGLDVMLFVQVKLNRHGREAVADFSQAIRDFPEVMECHVVMGNIDFLLRVVARDVESYQKLLLERLSVLPMVQEVHTMLALTEVKSTTTLPIEVTAETTG